MCGIAGFCRNPNDHDFNANTLAKTLLLGIEHRGKDATGAAWRDKRGNVQVQKHATTASEYVQQLSVWKKASTVILHTRMWTQGPPSNPDNNHPLIAGRITGVHNGQVTNDYELYRALPNYTPAGKVDSEAIFATINAVNEKYSVTDALEAPEATMAVSWLDATDEANEMHIARGYSNPLIVGQTVGGTVIWASTKDAVIDGAKSVGLELCYLDETEEGTYYKLRDGLIVEKKSFTPAPNWNYSRSYSSTSYGKSSGTYSNSDKTRTVPRKSKAMGSDFLDGKYLQYGTAIPAMSSEDYSALNKDRSEAVADWVELHSYVDQADGTLMGDHAIFSEAAARGAFLRPGSRVKVQVSDWLCDAQVYRLPRTFPEGQYILRVIIPRLNDNFEASGKYDVAFVAKTISDIVDGVDLTFDEPRSNTQQQTVSV